ncbi:MAG: hypothetical protein GX995_09280, partial [Clostridiales bacterium]|nr:hypothetical protein [Clostridiales bacterium]
MPTRGDFNRIEGNIQHVKDEIDNVELDAENINLNSLKFSSNNVKDGMEELFTSVSDGKQKIAAAITDMGQSASGSDTFEQLSDKIKDISKDANAAVSHVLSGKTFYQGGSKKTGTMPNRGAINNTITTQGGQIYIPKGYHNGSGKVTASFANLVPENIKSGVNIGGVVGRLDAKRCHVKYQSKGQYFPPTGGSIYYGLYVDDLPFTPNLVCAYTYSKYEFFGEELRVRGGDWSSKQVLWGDNWVYF